MHAFSLKVRLKIELCEFSWLFYKSYAKYMVTFWNVFYLLFQDADM